jgi:hypothetical protein
LYSNTGRPGPRAANGPRARAGLQPGHAAQPGTRKCSTLGNRHVTGLCSGMSWGQAASGPRRHAGTARTRRSNSTARPDSSLKVGATEHRHIAGFQCPRTSAGFRWAGADIRRLRASQSAAYSVRQPSMPDANRSTWSRRCDKSRAEPPARPRASSPPAVELCRSGRSGRHGESPRFGCGVQTWSFLFHS